MKIAITAWKNRAIHHSVWQLTLPMILSNISVPLVGIVDTAVMGRLPEADNMAAVALGSGLYLFLVGILNFLRMGTTGFTAQASGREDGTLLRQILLQSLILALLFALILGSLAQIYAPQLLDLLNQKEQLDLSSPPPLYLEEAAHFFNWRLWGLPAALLNFALVGWFLGRQNARVPLLIMITTNSVNMVLSILFVLKFHWGVVGAAQAAVIAEWVGFLVGLTALLRRLPLLEGGWNLSPLRKIGAWKPLLMVNGDIFLRSLALQIAFLLVTLQGVRIGESTVAANMIILNGLLLTSYLLDGFAHAIESLCGRAIGLRRKSLLYETLVVAGGWGLIVSLIFSLLALLFGRFFIDQLSTIEAVRQSAYPLLPYLMLLPLVSVWSYLFDGLFIGATRAKEMRNAMILSLVGGVVIGILLEPLGNNGLWIAFLSFMGLRGLFSALFAWRIDQERGWF